MAAKFQDDKCHMYSGYWNSVDNSDDDDDDDLPAICNLEKSSDDVLDIMDSITDVPDENPTDEEKKSLLKRFYEWLKKQLESVRSLLSAGHELDLDGELTLYEMMNIRKWYNWYTKAGAASSKIKCPTELCPGDHIAVKIKRKQQSPCQWIWWNHMIVTDVYQDGFDCICPCIPDVDPEKIKLESDMLSVQDIGLHFGSESRRFMVVSEFPMSWCSVKKAVRFDHDVNGKFSHEEIVKNARERLEISDWDINYKNSEQFAIEVTTGCESHPSDQKKIKEKAISITGQGICQSNFTLAKSIPLIFKVVLRIAKFIVRCVISDGVEIFAAISKTIKILGFIGLCIGPILDLCSCLTSIYLEHRKYKAGKVQKYDYQKFVAQKVAELMTIFFFTLLSVPCLLIPIPAIGIIVSGFLCICGWLVSKAVGFAVGKACDLLVRCR